MAGIKFQRQHHNAIAKLMRDNWPADLHNERKVELAVRGHHVNTCINFARYLKWDNPFFDPLHFLDACSPDSDMYPLSELWDESYEPKEEE